MKLTIGNGLLRIFAVIYVGWLIYYPIKKYYQYTDYRDTAITYGQSEKERHLRDAKEASERGDEIQDILSRSRASDAERQLQKTLRGWKQAHIDSIWDNLAVMFLTPLIWALPFVIIYWILRFILKGFVSQD